MVPRLNCDPYTSRSHLARLPDTSCNSLRRWVSWKLMRARIVSLLMKGGWEAKLRARLKQMKSANKDVGQSSREASLRSLSLVVVGGLLGFVCAWLVPLLST